MSLFFSDAQFGDTSEILTIKQPLTKTDDSCATIVLIHDNTTARKNYIEWLEQKYSHETQMVYENLREVLHMTPTQIKDNVYKNEVWIEFSQFRFGGPITSCQESTDSIHHVFITKLLLNEIDALVQIHGEIQFQKSKQLETLLDKAESRIT